MLGMPYIRALEVATFYTQFQLKPVGTPGPCPGLRHDALHAARRRGADGCLPLEDPSRPVPHQRRGHAVVGGGRVPRRLRQRADGDDLQGHLRGSDAGTARRDHRCLRRRQGRQRAGRPADRAHRLGAAVGPDDAARRKGGAEIDARQGSAARGARGQRSCNRGAGGRRCAAIRMPPSRRPTRPRPARRSKSPSPVKVAPAAEKPPARRAEA